MSAVTRLRNSAAKEFMTENHTVWLRVADLTIDSRYQRSLDERRAQRIADNVDPDAIGILHVSLRADGTRVVIDGQHRLGAMRLLGWQDQRIECKVYTGLTLPDEARLFDKLNESTKVQPIPKFMARVIANDHTAIAIQRILADNGWVVRVGIAPGCFMAVTAAETIYKGGKTGSDGPTALASTIRTVTDAWGHDTAAVNAYIIQGLGLIYTRHADLDRASLVRKLAGYPGSPTALIGAAKGLHSFRGGRLPQAVAEVIVELYNKKRSRGRLPDWRS